jgi:hypothetical protein
VLEVGTDNRPWRLRVALTNADSTRTDLCTSLGFGLALVVMGVSFLISADGFAIVFFGVVSLGVGLVRAVRDGVLLRRTFTTRSD